MNSTDIQLLLRKNSYPGRGIILGRSADNLSAVAAYFIMGRSLNSRNRVFVRTDDGIRTEAFDPSAMTDPSLIIYNPVRELRGKLIVTNGDQTDTVRDFIAAGKDLRAALSTREFEPDFPNYTPRISGILGDKGYSLSILKTLCGSPECCCRCYFDYDEAIPGIGHFISTYVSDGTPLPSFEGEPRCISLDYKNAQELADVIWDSLDEDNRVSLYVRYTDIATGKADVVIINKNK